MGVHCADDHYYAPKNRRFACSPIAWYSRRRNSFASSRGYLAMRKFFGLMLRRSDSAARACRMSSRLTPCGRIVSKISSFSTSMSWSGSRPAKIIEPSAEVADTLRQLLGLVDDDLVHLGVKGSNVGGDRGSAGSPKRSVFGPPSREGSGSIPSGRLSSTGRPIHTSWSRSVVPRTKGGGVTGTTL